MWLSGRHETSSTHRLDTTKNRKRDSSLDNILEERSIGHLHRNHAGMRGCKVFTGCCAEERYNVGVI